MGHILGSRSAAHTASGILGLLSAAMAPVLASTLLFAHEPCAAYAADVPSGQPNQTNVLVVDAGLGDDRLCALHWLGQDAATASEDAGHILATSAHPAWWDEAGGTGSAPATFLLYPAQEGIATTADDIAWALDAIRASQDHPQTFVVAMGAAGLSLRAYAEDLAVEKQSARADIVGMAFCGTPHNGYAAMQAYPELEMWDRIAQAAGLSAGDLNPQGSTIAELNEAAFPRVCKTLNIWGNVGDLGFGATDGAGIASDYALLPAVNDQVESAQVNATLGQEMNLTGQWSPFTSEIDYPQRTVDAQLTELLSGMTSYETSSEVQQLVCAFYKSWFAEQVPVTHNSNVLLLDLSGSMLTEVAAGETRLEAAEQASGDYLAAMASCSKLPQAAPADVAVIGFGEQTTQIAHGYGESDRNALSNMAAKGETDIGLALDAAMDALSTVPLCADKRVLLLSDGASTQGQTEEQMFAGSIASARAEGIVIDAVGFGDIGEADEGFLKRVTDATGGTFYQATDTYGLKVNFLKSYYSSLGMGLVDEELDAGAAGFDGLGAVDGSIAALQVGIVSEKGLPNVALTCKGDPIDEDLYEVSEENGFTSVRIADPPAGEYGVSISGGEGALHVFAAKQRGISKAVAISGEAPDYSLYMIIGVGVLLVVALVATVVLTRSRTAKARQSRAAVSGVDQGKERF